MVVFNSMTDISFIKVSSYYKLSESVKNIIKITNVRHACMISPTNAVLNCMSLALANIYSQTIMQVNFINAYTVHPID